jgi:hypothetical protein
VSARLKVWVCDRSLAEIVSSNSAGGMSVCCECCVLSGRGLWDGLITRPEESYRLWCDQESSTMRMSWPIGALLRHGNTRMLLFNQISVMVIKRAFFLQLSHFALCKYEAKDCDFWLQIFCSTNPKKLVPISSECRQWSIISSYNISPLSSKKKNSVVFS